MAHLEQRPILIFTDGSWEKSHAGIGAVTIDVATGSKEVWAGEVPPELLERWRRLVGEQLICQIELYVMVLMRWMLADRLKDRRTIWWVDNEAARFAVIKGISPSAEMRNLVRHFYHFETFAPTYSWIERVPSYSNPADPPSRGAPEEILRMLQVSECRPLEHPAPLIAKILQSWPNRKGE